MDLTNNTNSGLNKIDSGFATVRTNKIHLHLQQMGRRNITIIQDLDDDLDFKRICKNMRKLFSCNGTITIDEKMGTIIQLQGDQRQQVKDWLLTNEILTPNTIDRLVIHGI
jgi:translation initiation factor 1